MRSWLTETRESLKLSQAAVAKQTGITQQSYQAIEAGKTSPKPETAMRIAAVLGFKWTRFFEEDDDEQRAD